MRRAFSFFGLVVAAIVVFIGGSWLYYMPNASERGVWRAQSGNMVLSLTRAKADVYGISRHSCGTLYTFPAHLKLVELLEGARVDMVGDTLRLQIDGSLEPYLFDRIADVPDACLTPLPPTPRNVFDAMWTAMDEHYAFFDIHGVDWDSRRALAPAIDADMTDQALLELLGTALDGLDDGHIQIGTPFTYFSPKQPPVWLPADSPLTRASLTDVARRNAGTALTPLPDTPISFGLRDDGLAYVLIPQMDVVQAWGQDSQSAMVERFAPLAAVLRDARGVVIDVRHNPGGSDPVALGLAGHFTDQSIPVFTKTSRIGDGQSAPFTAYLPALGDTPLDLPVIVLTSDMTGSAAEIFTLAMRELPHVTTLGEPTSGGLSDILGFTLPNGWAFGLSNQTYLTNDGTLFEGIGVTPDIAVPFVAAAFEAGRDPVLEAAFATLTAQTGN